MGVVVSWYGFCLIGVETGIGLRKTVLKFRKPIYEETYHENWSDEIASG